MNREQIAKLVSDERDRQDDKWGWPQFNSLSEWMVILGEEYGEACQEVLRVRFAEKSPKDLVEELIQCAAVIFSILEHEEIWRNSSNQVAEPENPCYSEITKVRTTSTTKENNNKMSENKFKYFTVTSESTVMALNKTDALRLAQGRRGVSGRVLDANSWVDRIPASEAHAVSAQSISA